MDIKEFDNRLHDAEIKMKRLKALYEQWFQGIERTEPLIPKKDLERLLSMLRKERPRNTAARFRFQQLQARYNTYQTYWRRISRRIEEGTYERDIRRARQRNAPAAAAAEPVKEFELDLEVDIDVNDLNVENEIDAAINALAALESQAPAAAPKPKKKLSAFSPLAVARSERPGAASGKGRVNATFGKPVASSPTNPRPQLPAQRPQPQAPAQNQAPARAARPQPARPQPAPQAAAGGGLRKLYDRYLDAKRRNNERTDNLQYAKLERSVKQMRQKLSQKHKGKNIDFEVVVRNGRVGLKPKIS